MDESLVGVRLSAPGRLVTVDEPTDASTQRAILAVDVPRDDESVQPLAALGPCPPDRKHRYFFKLFALDVILDLDSSATKKDVEKAMAGHMLDKAELMGIYER